MVGVWAWTAVLYVPRQQTEELARRAAGLLSAHGGRAADLCTGAGAVAAHIAAATGTPVVGTDTDVLAVSCARRNGVRAAQGDLGAPLGGGTFSVVTAVAPYVPTQELVFLPADVRRYEPGAALDGGADGLDVVRRVVSDAARLLQARVGCSSRWAGLRTRRLSVPRRVVASRRPRCGATPTATCED